MEKFIIGIDGGGSKTHAVLIDASGKIIDEAFAGAANIKNDASLAFNSITHVIDALFNNHNLVLNQVQIGIGIAGFSDHENLITLQHKLENLYPQLIITSDAHIACLSCHQEQQGSIIICGTGVVGYNISNPKTTQLSGWGFPYGDLGGGAWIGLELCRKLCKSIDETYKATPILRAIYSRFDNDKNIFKNWLFNARPSDYGDIARLLPEFIKQNDQTCEEIMFTAINEISGLIEVMVDKFPHAKIAISGGLAEFYYPLLQKNFPQLIYTHKSHAYGAYFLFN